jgi:Ca2+-binding EF-hand superfamily protein
MSLPALLAAVALGLSPTDSPTPELPQDVFAAWPGDDVLDVVAFGSERAVVLRLHIRIDGKGYRAAWYESMIRLYHYLDRNDNGVLSVSEVTRAPWTALLFPPFTAIRASQRPQVFELDPKGNLTFDKFLTYLSKAWDVEAVTLQVSPVAVPATRTDLVFRFLDRDSDRKVSLAEMEKTDDRLVDRDRDEDELLDQTEITPDGEQMPTQVVRRRLPQPGVPNYEILPAVGLTSLDVRTAVATRLLSSYGTPRESANTRVLRPEAIRANSDAFRAFDRDRDGLLDLEELKNYLQSPRPALEFSVDLGRTKQEPGNRLAARPNAAVRVPGDPTTRRSEEAGAEIASFDEAEIQIKTVETGRTDATLLTQQFRSADLDKDRILSRQEARTVNALLQLFLVIDRNEDGKLTEQELNEYAERGRDVNDNRISLTLTDRGADLFQMLDDNRDNHLSMRELRSARTRFASMDRNRDGFLAVSELSRRCDLTFARGPVQNQNAFIVMTKPSGASSNAVRRARPIPTWFKGMDQNGDGDVSRREFLGPSTIFRQIDRDNDGLIDVEEASRAADP